MKKITLCFALLTILLAFVGCGDDQQTKQPSKNTPDPEKTKKYEQNLYSHHKRFVHA